ncbi:PhnD/SsuA/transferrin family substrate-binding protein [Candidatus Margulisiibacteriota bacterium]
MFTVRKKILLLVIILFILPTLIWSGSKVYFYIPEANIHDYSLIKNVFGAYLAKFGDLNFQPHSNESIFKKAIKKEKNGIFIMSSWLFNKLNTDNQLKPVFVMETDDGVTTKEVLVVKNTTSIKHLLSGGVLATSRCKVYVRHILEELFPGKDISKIKIIVVPRDMDALVSVEFGMSLASITSNDSYKKLKTINKTSYQHLKVLAKTKKMLRPIVVVNNNNKNDNKNIYKMLVNMSEDNDSKMLLDLMSFKRWKQITDREIKLLGISNE